MDRDRQSVRLKGWDYRSTGYYFVTICTYQREFFLGDINNKKMHLSDIGEVARKYWQEIPKHFSHVKIDRFVIMPDHMHGIIKIIDDNVLAPFVGAQHAVPLQMAPRCEAAFQKILPGSLGVIIRSYKSAVTKRCREYGYDEFRWQRNYHDKIIRTKKELQNKREYIINNPKNFQKENPHQ